MAGLKPNKQQQTAIEHLNGPMLVVAGAGTGKTRVITERIAYLINERQIPPGEILALTFTEKAAGEMLDRLDVLIGWQAYQVNVMTFHAFGSQLLLRFGHHLGVPTRAEIISETAKLVLLRRHLDEVQLSYYGAQDDILDFLEGRLSEIATLQNADIDVDAYREYVAGLGQTDLHPLDIAEAQDILKLYELYELLKRRYGVIDYSDQVNLPLQLLTERPNLADRLTKQYQYVLVDEYQDTNAAQDALLRAFIPPGGNIFAVGDDDQAIYGFRGAQLENILDFSEHFGVKKPVVLTQNYRSTQAVLDAAYALIQGNNPDRLEARLGIDKKLRGEPDGVSPEFVPYASPEQEREGVANAIAECLAAGQPANTIAVLATSHAALRNLVKPLKSHGITYNLSSSINIFEQPELLQLWHLLRWIALMAEDEAIIQLLHGPFVGWSHGRVRRLLDYCRQEVVTVEEALEAQSERQTDSEQLVSNLQRWRIWADEVPVSQLAYRLVFETGLSDAWISAAQDSPRMVRVFEDLQLWLQQMQQYEHVAADPGLAGYLATFPKPPNIEVSELIGDERGVSLLTVHAAKGLEFETVFIINNTREAWNADGPTNRMELPQELTNYETDLPPEHERRRLLYVALTRAKRALVLSAPVQTAGGRTRKPSPFLQKIFTPEQLATAPSIHTDTSLQASLQSLQRFAPKTMHWQADQLPFETSEGWLELSTTDIERYEYCPYEFYLEKVLRIRTPLGPQISFGNVLHQLFHEYYQSRQLGEPLELTQLKQRLDERWDVRGYRTAEEAETDRELALATLEAFFEREEAAKRQLRATEEPITLALPEHKLRLKGRLDASFELPEGIEVRDFKTGRARDTEKLAQKAKNSLQLRTYALALEERTGAPPAQVVLDYVVSGVEGIASLSPRILKNHRQKIGKLADSIRNREFAPNSSPFHQCLAHRYWGTGEGDA